MAFSVDCPCCGHSLLLLHSQRGRSITCPRCYSHFPALTEEERQGENELSQSETEEGNQAQQEPVTQVRPEVAGIEGESAPVSRTTNCPDCGGIVSKQAATCPHCGRMFRGGSTTKGEWHPRKRSADTFQERKSVPSSWWVLGIFIPIVGFILGIVALVEQRQRAVVFFLVMLFIAPLIQLFVIAFLVGFLQGLMRMSRYELIQFLRRL